MSACQLRLVRPAPIYAGGVLIVAAIVVVAVVLIVIVGRDARPGAATAVTAVSAEGLRIEPGGEPQVVPWSSIFEITVVTRWELRRTWFGFEILTEGNGLLLLDGSRGPGVEFLAESHRLQGFDHRRLGRALTRRGSRVVCYSS